MEQSRQARLSRSRRAKARSRLPFGALSSLPAGDEATGEPTLPQPAPHVCKLVRLRGGDLYRLKEILGHANVETTLKYAHLRPEALCEEMQKMFGDGSTDFALGDGASHAAGEGTSSRGDDASEAE